MARGAAAGPAGHRRGGPPHDLDNLPDGYVEQLDWGTPCYAVPLERSGRTYNGKPLMYAALASLKRHIALHLTGVYVEEGRLERFREAWLATGRRLDMGRSCLRFRRLEDVPPEVVGATIAEVEVDDLLAAEAAARQR